MSALAPRIFGRTNESVTPVWRQRTADPTVIDADDWLVLTITPDALDRRPHTALEQRLALLGRHRADVLLLTDILASELKIGWPMHRMQQLRERKLCRYFAIETHEPLEAEWITANAPVHAVVVPYTPLDLSVRYRVFEASRNAGVAMLARAKTSEEASLHLGTPEICATIVDSRHAEGIAPAPADRIDGLWTAYQKTHPEPQKLRSGHPPDYGV